MQEKRWEPRELGWGVCYEKASRNLVDTENTVGAPVDFIVRSAERNRAEIEAATESLRRGEGD